MKSEIFHVNTSLFWNPINCLFFGIKKNLVLYYNDNIIKYANLIALRKEVKSHKTSPM